MKIIVNKLTLQMNLVRNWTQLMLLEKKIGPLKLRLKTSILSSFNCLRSPPLVSVSQWFTSRTRNSRYLTSYIFFIQSGKRKMEDSDLDEENIRNSKKEKLIGM